MRKLSVTNEVESKFELSHLKNYNQKLINQIKKHKDDKKSMKNSFEELIAKEASNSSIVAFKVEEKETNVDPINITFKTKPNPI